MDLIQRVPETQSGNALALPHDARFHPDSEHPLCMVLGLPFHALTMGETLADCSAMLRDHSTPHYVVTANLDFAYQASRDDCLRDFIFEADLILCDGLPLVWLSRLVGTPLPERVAGADVIPRLLEQCAEEGTSIFFLGSDAQTMTEARGILTERHPGLRIVGHLSPPVGKVQDWDDGSVRACVKKAAPDLLLVALGCPKQEQWIARNYRALGIPLTIGIGASLDFIAGKESRAPKVMQKIGLEWFWRMSGNPSRLAKRYAADLLFLFRAGWGQWKASRIASGRPVKSEGVLFPQNLKDNTVIFNWIGEAVGGGSQPLPEAGAGVEMILCDCSKVSRLDASGLGDLAALARRARRQGVRFGVFAPSEPVRQMLLDKGLEDQVPIFDSPQEVEEVLEGDRRTVWERNEYWAGPEGAPHRARGESWPNGF